MRVVDDRGAELSWERPPERIVSLVPSVSETVWHLGAGDRLVGVTRFCTDPPEVRRLPRCGGTKDPDLERISSLRPDLVLMSEEENRAADFEALRGRGVAVFVSFPRRVDDVADWLRRLGDAIDRPAAARAAAAEVDDALAGVRRRAAERGRRRRVFCPIWKRPWMTFNADTYTHDVLAACGGDNVFAAAGERYCTVTLEEVAARAPDLVLLPDEPYPFGARDLPDLEPLGLAGAGPPEVRLVDGRALSWYGVRTPEGLRRLEESLFGGIA